MPVADWTRQAAGDVQEMRALLCGSETQEVILIRTVRHVNIDQPATTPRHRKEVRDALPHAALSLEPFCDN